MHRPLISSQHCFYHASENSSIKFDLSLIDHIMCQNCKRMNLINENLIIKDFRTLKVWQKANALEQEIEALVKAFPSHEQYRLVDQIIRSSRSISANIAEGNTQLFIKRELFHANAALGSCGETRNHLLTAYQNNYISKEQFKILDEKFLELIKMLYGYIKRLKSNLDNESDAAEP